MEQVWERFKKIEGRLLEGVFANKLDVYQESDGLALYAVEPLLSVRKDSTPNTRYWKMDWIEDDAGDDFLFLKDQETPEPIEYEPIDQPFQKHLLMGSSFSVQRNAIEQVSGYGFKDRDGEILSSLILKLEESYLSIETGAVIKIKITDKEPEDLRDRIF